MKNILLLSFDGVCRIDYDVEPEFQVIVNTWDETVTEYPHDCLGVFYSPTQRHGEAMYVQGKILQDLGIEYDYVASFCHDLEIKVSEINRYFYIAAGNGLDCFGPSTSEDSFISHKEFKHQGGGKLVHQNWIEIMAIGFSKRLYDDVFYHLNILYGQLNLVSGWGLDNKLIKKIIKQNKYKCAMIDEIQVHHTKKVTDGSIVWRNGMTSRECMTFYSEYVREMNSKRFKRFIEAQTKKVKGTKPLYRPARTPDMNVLYVRLTCRKEMDQWDSYRRSNINQVLLCGDPNLPTMYELDGDVLYLRCEDTYEFLPSKMIMAFNSILLDDKFKDITHIIKIDNDIDVDLIWEYVFKNESIYKNNDYTGGKLYKCHMEPGATWHFGSIPPTSPWYNKPFFEKRVMFASGGHTYSLSRKSLEKICAEFDFNNIDEVHRRYILEDMMVGLILERNGIKPFPNGVEVVNTSFKHRDSLIKKIRAPEVLPSTTVKASSGAKEKDTSTDLIETKPVGNRPKDEKNLVVQIFFDNSLITNNPKTQSNHNRGPLITSKMINNELFKESQAKAREYAIKCGAEYELFVHPIINFFSASMERMRLIEEEYWAKNYDNILYLDCDVIISDECPNLFKLYPQHNLRACPTLMNPDWLVRKETYMSQVFGTSRLKDCYFNGGVLLFHKSTLNLMRGKLDYRNRFKHYAFDDQSELNWVVMENNIPITMMSSEFNSRPDMKGKITHYLGNLKKTYKSEPAKRDKRRRTNRGPLLIIRVSNPTQSGKWKSIRNTDECDELILCVDPKLKVDSEMVDGVFHIRGNPTDTDLDSKIIKTICKQAEFKRYSHMSMININKNTNLIYKDISYAKLRHIHAVGETLRPNTDTPGPYILSRKSISYLKMGQSKEEWGDTLIDEGIEIFHFDYIKL